MSLMQIIPVSGPLFAVFTDEDGRPQFAAIQCLGAIEIREGQRVVTGFSVGEHLEPSDGRPNFVGYATTTESEPWMKKCADKRAAIVQKEADEKKPKIFVPEQKKVASWQ